MNEMLLRGCMLKNSRYILGLVVYTGPESRIQMNAAKTPNKVGAPGRDAARLRAAHAAQRRGASTGRGATWGCGEPGGPASRHRSSGIGTPGAPVSARLV